MEEIIKKIMLKYSFLLKQIECEDEHGVVSNELIDFYECYNDDSQKMPTIILYEIYKEAQKELLEELINEPSPDIEGVGIINKNLLKRKLKQLDKKLKNG